MYNIIIIIIIENSKFNYKILKLNFKMITIRHMNSNKKKQIQISTNQKTELKF